jgi:signal transduction histidine kinase
MSEIQVGTYEPAKLEIDIFQDVIKDILTEYKFTAKKKDVDLTLICLTENTKIIGDQYSISQIFVNLIDNAIKYTDKGFIKITIERDNENNLNVIIEDSGIGISQNYLSELFEPFSQEEQGYTRAYEGSGLGLALVKKYCEINNADISVESIKNVGTKFKLKFTA